MNPSSLHSAQNFDRRVGLRCGETSAYRAAPGQTLIELASIIALLGAVATIGVVYAVSLGNFRCEPTTVVTKNDLPALRTGLESYRSKTGHFPLESLEELVAANVVDRAPQDPWGNPYRYSLDGEQPVITSMGPDGFPGTADDLSSNDLPRRAAR